MISESRLSFPLTPCGAGLVRRTGTTGPGYSPRTRHVIVLNFYVVRSLDTPRPCKQFVHLDCALCEDDTDFRMTECVNLYLCVIRASNCKSACSLDAWWWTPWIMVKGAKTRRQTLVHVFVFCLVLVVLSLWTIVRNIQASMCANQAGICQGVFRISFACTMKRTRKKPGLPKLSKKKEETRYFSF